MLFTLKPQNLPVISEDLLSIDLDIITQFVESGINDDVRHHFLKRYPLPNIPIVL